MKRPGKIAVVDRFLPLRQELLRSLGDLSEDDWRRPTAAPRWSVKDVAAHLLGGDIGILSRQRDGFTPGSTGPKDYPELVALVNRLNEEWTIASRRMSPRLVCALLSFTGPQVEAYFSSLDLDAMGGPVSWAGPEPAPVWLDIAREFTERWHHQQQIRDAVEKPPLYDPYFLSPVLDAFVRAIPYNLRHTTVPGGTGIRFEISGDAGGVWFLVHTGEVWDLVLECDARVVLHVTLPQDMAWRMFTKGIDGDTARRSAAIRGDAALALPIFNTISVIG